MSQQLKIALHHLCQRSVEEKIAQSQEALRVLEASAREETKSSAGDKYETAREMMQQEKDKASRQLHEAVKLRQMLDQFKPEKESPEVQAGSLVLTNIGHFYITVSLGEVEMGGERFMVISPVSPLARHLIGLKAGTETTFNGRKIQLLEVV